MSVNTKVNGQLVKSAGLYSVTKPIGMADIYSTEEKEVGLWVDNKPLYQKTFIITPTSASFTVDISSLNLEKLIDRQATLSRAVSNPSGTQQKDVQYRTETSSYNSYGVVCELRNNTSIQVGIEGYTVSEITEMRVTLKYTKTTDTPWSGKFVPQGYGYVSSGDIYSFEERQIGVWADGKPLYQKTLYIASLPSSKSTGTYSLNVSNAENCWVVDANSGTGNLDMIRIAESSVNDMQSASIYARCGVVDGDVKVYVEVGRDRSSMSAYVTVRYTKTTDVAGSGEYVPSGDKAVHYSTEEQVIGTWIDGSTLYEKTIDIGALPNSATSKSYAHGITGNIVRYDISAIDASGTVIQLPFYTTATNYNIGVYVTNTNIVVETQRDSSGYTHCYATLRYTKTS